MTQSQWQLDDLYSSYESPEFNSDWQRMKQLVQEFKEVNLESTSENVRQIIALLEEQRIVTSRLSSFIRLNLSTDTTDPTSNNYQNQWLKLMAEFAEPSAKIYRFLGEIDEALLDDDLLSDYQFFFHECQVQAEHLLSDEVEAAMSQLSLSGGQAWANLHNYLTSTVEEDYDGESLTLTQLRNLAYDSDSEVRRSAYETELKLYDQIKGSIAFALNHIKSEVTTVAKMRHFDSPMEETLIQSRMSQATLDALLEAMVESLPKFQDYLFRKGELLGHSQGLPFYDLFAPLGDNQAEFTIQEAKDYLVTRFNEFSPDLAELTQEAFDQRYIDFYPRSGKVGGAFCSNLPFIKQSRVLMNFDGSLSSVITLAHELGHAYHGLHIQDHRPLNWSYSMPVAETASTFNEILIMEGAIQEATNDEEKAALIEPMLQDLTQIIVDIYSRYLFESSVFEASSEQFLFADDLEELMLDAQRKAYGKGLDANYLHPYMWVNKGHYYSTGRSYYNFPYAFGGLFARGLYAIYRQQPEGFVTKYQELLKATTVSTVEETASRMGIDVTSKDFWRQTLAEVTQYIDQWIELTE